MKQFFLISTIVAILFSSKVSAQIHFSVAEDVPVRYVYTYINPLDSLFKRDRVTGILHLPEHTYNTETMRGLTFRDTLFYNPLFLPVVFNGQVLPRNLSFFPTQEERNVGMLLSPRHTLAPQLARIDFARDVRRQFYRENPTHIQYSTESFPNIRSANDDDLRSFNPFRQLIRPESSVVLAAPEVTGATIQRRYWQYSGEHNFQFAQTYVSDNWHRGGINNTNINNHHIVRMNYRRNKISFNNTFDWRLVLNSAPNDTLRNYSISNDELRYIGAFGIDAFGRGWSYTSNLTARTQTFKGYPPNSRQLLSAFLAPLYVNIGIGLTYKMDKRSEKVRHRRWRLDSSVLPASIDMRYVGHPNVNVTRFGLEEGQTFRYDIGSTVNTTFIFDINRHIDWTVRFHYFTSFEKVVSELNNTLNVRLTNALSTRIFIQMRYDDSVLPYDKEGNRYSLGLLQTNQMLSFGLNYKW